MAGLNERKTIEDPAVRAVLDRLEKKEDIKSLRIKRLLAAPDLTRTAGSPLKMIIDAIIAMPRFRDFDLLQVPEIVSVKNNFDLLNTPLDHPSRRETDTYYPEKEWVLRTHTTVMWPYHLSDEVRNKLEEKNEVGALCYGKVYRKDEIDRSHYPVFHQIDGWYLCRKDKKIIGIPELEEVLLDIAKNIYGPAVNYKFSEDTFPFTDPSIEMAIESNGNWFEILGAGVVHTEVLRKLGIDPNVWNGWAFGFGLERLVMAKMNVPDIRIFWSKDPRITSQFRNLESVYREVSKYPMTYRDISFVIGNGVDLKNYYEMVRDCAQDLVEEVKLLDTYENEEKFGRDKKSYTFRIVYRSPERTLTNEEVDKIQKEIETRTKEEFGAAVR
ncbi:MAG: Phenylalanine-tRNA ligase [Candidatus Jorgensenbacteria bacterium GW2011_GWA1_48_11]|uniref:phenylalanine--tRNA ligase n=1 Tax=Candidatus Jorgensenbacteria bacterium GW2011_GWA1_48_11 TaxID=1618660 RepID=A0A0G1UC42_9BACT|nr:MAG: Phenylalanine-tRNA ligase [Candidatus Jorgensenbacteria bacterium GW2011_GWA1_48_11]KKW12183.1 MAG: Phenylalanine-tRNA ligase [Candidatus Jorgensenbacteria bacterium GW2011_GWB1_49_9]